MTAYPRTNAAGETVWACCESSIGYPCQHRRIESRCGECGLLIVKTEFGTWGSFPMMVEHCYGDPEGPEHKPLDEDELRATLRALEPPA